MEDFAFERSNLLNTKIPPIISMKYINGIRCVQSGDPNFALTCLDNKICPLDIEIPLSILNPVAKAFKLIRKSKKMDGRRNIYSSVHEGTVMGFMQHARKYN